MPRTRHLADSGDVLIIINPWTQALVRQCWTSELTLHLSRSLTAMPAEPSCRAPKDTFLANVEACRAAFALGPLQGLGAKSFVAGNSDSDIGPTQST